MKYRGAVFFDYDGTLTDDRAGIMQPTQATRRAIEAFQRKGYLAVLSTGRAMCYADETGIPFDGMVTSNGTHVEVSGEVILDCPIETEKLRRLTARLNEMGVYYGIDNPKRCYARDVSEASFRNWLTTFELDESVFRNIEPGEDPVGYKLSVLFHDMKEIEALRREFQGEFVFDCQQVFKCADVSEAGFNKAVGVKAVCEYFHLPLGNTYAFGDGMNDLDMIRCVGHGVAMGDHAPALEEYAEFITRRVCDEGIEYGLRHFGLI